MSDNNAAASKTAHTTSKVEFPGAGGETLAAALDRPAGPAPRAYVLFAHCFSCSKDVRAARDIARALAGAGFGVLRFDFTGLGGSEGEFANTNFSSNVDDLVKAADFLRAEFAAPSLLVGHSLGGAAAIVAADRIPEVKAVATIGAPAESAHVLAHVAEQRAEIEAKGAAVVSLGGRPFTIRKQFLDDLDGERVTDAAAALGRPLLVMHAPLDATVGIDNASRLFLAAKHPKSFVSLDTADHLLSKPGDGAYAADVLAAWAGRFLDVAPPVEAGSGVAPFRDGARASRMAGRNLAVSLSVDGHPMTIDASAAEGGDDLGPNPTRTVEGALAACAVMTMTMYARRKGWPMENVDVTVKRAEGEDSHAAGALVKTIRLDGPLDDDQRARLLEIADKCPVHRMLSNGVKIISSIG